MISFARVLKTLRRWACAGCTLLGAVSWAGGGNGSGTRGGGDLCELEYRGLIPSVSEWVYRNHTRFRSQVDPAKFLVTALSQTVQCAPDGDEFILDGVPKSAITDIPANLTRVNQARWAPAPVMAKKALLLHETLVQMKIEKTADYHVSELFWSVSPAPFKVFRCGLSWWNFDVKDQKTEARGGVQSDVRDGHFEVRYKQHGPTGWPEYSVELKGKFKGAFDQEHAAREVNLGDANCFGSEVDAYLITCYPLKSSYGPHLVKVSLSTEGYPGEGVPFYRIQLRSSALKSLINSREREMYLKTYGPENGVDSLSQTNSGFFSISYRHANVAPLPGGGGDSLDRCELEMF